MHLDDEADSSAAGLDHLAGTTKSGHLETFDVEQDPVGTKIVLVAERIERGKGKRKGFVLLATFGIGDAEAAEARTLGSKELGLRAAVTHANRLDGDTILKTVAPDIALQDAP